MLKTRQVIKKSFKQAYQVSFKPCIRKLKFPCPKFFQVLHPGPRAMMRSHLKFLHIFVYEHVQHKSNVIVALICYYYIDVFVATGVQVEQDSS